MTYTKAGPEVTTRPGEEPTGWVGWIYFAAAMLFLVGIFQGIAGIVGIVKDTYYLVPSKNLLVTVDYTAWGWTHLGIGIVAVVTALGLMAGQFWARVIGVIIAGLSAIVALGFLAAYPVWAVLIIAFDVLVIWALTVHGREMKQLS